MILDGKISQPKPHLKGVEILIINRRHKTLNHKIIIKMFIDIVVSLGYTLTTHKVNLPPVTTDASHKFTSRFHIVANLNRDTRQK